MIRATFVVTFGFAASMPLRSRRRRNKPIVWSLVLLTFVSSALAGCRWRDTGGMYGDPDLAYFRSVATEIDMPDVPSDTSGVQSMAAPLTLSEKSPIDYWDISLQECVQLALTNSQVMRDLGMRSGKAGASSRSSAASTSPS